eukprot:6537304-Pyramimonas_sp.AAC.1
MDWKRPETTSRWIGGSSGDDRSLQYMFLHTVYASTVTRRALIAATISSESSKVSVTLSCATLRRESRAKSSTLALATFRLTEARK